MVDYNSSSSLIFNEDLSSSSFNKNYGPMYNWMWDEFANVSGPIVGDDSVVWGRGLGPFYNYEELTAKLILLENLFPNLVQLFSIGKTHHGRDIWTLRITNQSITHQKSEFHLVAHHHAREVITIPNTMYFVDKLLYEVNIQNPLFTELLKHREIYVTPMLNPDGLEVLHRFPWMRKNHAPIDEDNDGTLDDEEEIFDVNDNGFVAEIGYYYEGIDSLSDADALVGEDAPGGVDLNRNYGYEFIGGGSSANPRSQTYRGEYPFSEPETQAIRDFVRQHDFNFAISLHSGVKAVIGPWGYTNDPAPDQVEINAIVAQLCSVTGYPTWDEIGGYKVNGEWGDWCYGVEGIFAFTLETYGGPNTKYSSEDGGYVGIWDVFNPAANLVIQNSLSVWNAMNYMLQEPRETISNQKPTIELHNPTDFVTEENYTLSWNATDPENDSLSFNIYCSLDGLYWTEIVNNTLGNSFEFNPSDLLDMNQSYFVKIAVNDGINRVIDISDTKLTGKNVIDTSIMVTGVHDGDFLAGTQNLFVELENETEIEKVVFQVDNEFRFEDLTAPFEFQWDINKELEGNHILSIVLYLDNGQTKQRDFSVYTYPISNNSYLGSNISSIPKSHDNPLPMISVLLCILFIALMRLKRSRTLI